MEQSDLAGRFRLESADVRRFFQLFTLLWAVCFSVKAALYLWIGVIVPLAEAMAVRSIFGGVTLGLMIALSATQGRRLSFLCRRLGLLPPDPLGAADRGRGAAPQRRSGAFG